MPENAFAENRSKKLQYSQSSFIYYYKMENMPELSLKTFKYLNIIFAVSIIVAALLLSRNIITYSLAEKEMLPASTNNKVKTKKTVLRNTLMQYSDILTKNPFGEPMTLRAIGQVIEDKEEKAYSKPHDLILVGTVTGPDYLSYAIFQEKNSGSGQEVFALGEEVLNYGKLNSIKKDSVELKHNSIIETIMIPDEKASKQSAEQTSTNKETGAFARKVGEKEYVLDARKVQQSIENPEKIMTDARMLPNIKDGRQEGFNISEVVKDGLYHSLGLRNGDTLLKINGLEISNPEVAIQAMTALRGMNRLTLDIIRNGKNTSLSYEIK